MSKRIVRESGMSVSFDAAVGEADTMPSSDVASA